MRKIWSVSLFILAVLGPILVSPAALATDYDFSGSVGDATYPPCDGWGGVHGWTVNGSATYTCSKSISLAIGDSISNSKNITVVGDQGIALAGSNTIGSASKTVNLKITSGAFAASNNAGTSSTIYGNLTSVSGSISLASVTLNGSIASSTGNVTLTGASTVTGNITTGGWLSVAAGSIGGNVSANNGVTMTGGTLFKGSISSSNNSISLAGGSVSGDVSGRNGVTTSNTVISGDVIASNGPISLSGGSVGTVYSDCCSLTTNGTDIKGDVKATIGSSRDTVSITGGTISGAISTSGGRGIFITNATVTSGSITTTNVQITISNSNIGSPTSQVNVTNNGNQSIDIKGTSVVYGDVTTGGKLTIDSTAKVWGNCGYSSISGQCKPYVPGPDHIQLELSGSPLTCAPSTVIVKACTTAAPGCAPLYTATATAVTLSASNGAFWSASPVTFTGSTTVALRKTTVGSTTLIATSSGSGATACYLNSSTNNCQISFEDSALLLSIPLQSAGVTSSGDTLMTVSAVRASNSGKECVAAFGGQTRNVKFWSSYDDPSTGTKTLAVKGTTIPMSATSLAASNPTTGTAVALAFDNTGTASVPLKYDDAGQLLLKARYDGSSATNDINLVMVGSSLFVTAPYGLCVDSSDQNPDGTPAWLCTAADPASCSKYRKAGEAFAFRVSGKASSSPSPDPDKKPTPAELCAMPTTANYRQSSIALSVKVVAPSDGDNGALGTQTINITANGTATISQQTHSEVGVFTFTAIPPAKAYFGQTVAPGTSADFGRFIPDHFAITSGTVAPACGGFSYFGQDGFTTSFTLAAQNSSSGMTTNYRGDFAKLVLSAWNAYGFATAAALPAGSTLAASSTPPSGNWVKGVAAVSAKHQISRPSALAGETSVTLTALPVDSDGVTMSKAGAVHSNTTPLRFGRLRLQSGQGSGQLPYVVRTEAQYWDGTYWRTNAQDSCTGYAPANVKVTGSTGTSVSAASGISNAYGSLTLSKPTSLGAAKVCLDTGTLASDGCIAASPASIGYLRGNWDPNRATSYDQDPSATVLFGGANADSRGNWGFLYRRENF
jgi:MSHA biogenesis protein MshQ